MNAAIVLLLAAVPMAVAGSADPRAALLAADRAFAAATAARGLDGWLEYFADDAVIFPERGPAVSGKEAIAAYYRETGFDPRPLRWQPTAARLDGGCGLGTTWGVWTLELPGDGGEAVTRRGKYLTVWQRQADGRWKVVADIGNAEP